MEIKRRDHWEIEETRFFLNLMRERQVMKNLDGQRFRSDKIFKFLESPMQERGYNKTAKQMQTRFKTLRLQYNKIKRQMGKNGSGNIMSSFMYAEKMGDLLNFRPVAIGDVVDSTPSQDYIDNGSYLCNSIEEQPDPLDVPGCSSTFLDNSMPLSEEDSYSESSTPNRKKRKVSRSHEATFLRYADKLKENYEEIQSNIMAENRSFIERIMESEKELEKEIVNDILESQKSMLKETTNQLLTGFQQIFASMSSSQPSIASVPTFNSTIQSPVVISPGHYSSPSNSNPQVLHSSNSFPKVLINLQNPEKATVGSVKKTITANRYLQDENDKPK